MSSQEPCFFVLEDVASSAQIFSLMGSIKGALLYPLEVLGRAEKDSATEGEFKEK
jgi:hypothetical protein